MIVRGSFMGAGAAAAVLGLTALSACTPQQNASVLPAGQTMVAQEVQFGTVVSSRAVTVQGSQTNQVIGAIVGGVAGAALGNEVGKGTGKVLATGAGATAGAAAGQAAGRAAGTTQSIEWTVRLDSGRAIAVVQGSPVFAVGQRVQVITGNGQTRI